MTALIDGPASPYFLPVSWQNGESIASLSSSSLVSPDMALAAEHAPSGDCVLFGIPFLINHIFILSKEPFAIPVGEFQAEWLVFLHTSDTRHPVRDNNDFLVAPNRGQGQLNELAAYYSVLYETGSEEKVEIRRRHQIGMFRHRWGENCFQAVEDHKPYPIDPATNRNNDQWGGAQTRVSGWGSEGWSNWLWAWKNPHPTRVITGIQIQPVSGVIILSGLSQGNVVEHPLRWQRRKKVIFSVPPASPTFGRQAIGAYSSQLQLDLGQVISVQNRIEYPQESWEQTYNNQLPIRSENELIVEYTSHPQALFHFADGSQVPVNDIQEQADHPLLKPVFPAYQRINIKVIDRISRKPVGVKLHLHGESGEYLAPVDRHRIINGNWFEDYSADFTHRGLHSCTYINGETLVDLPTGKVYLEVSKGFEVRPIRKILEIQAGTEEIIIEVDKVLPWREKGWVTADTHVHFLSPVTALLEGSGEGVNVINLLASQWGELMTNVGDFDGKTTWGSKEAGGEGEYLVRVGTENRQHVLGHISLLGYRGRIIAPMTTSGPDEAALGDPVEVLLSEWARACRQQGGLVVLPHFPEPRAEHAASLINGDIDALEMTSWGDHYSGIDPYSLSDWYRYLNCGHLVAAVGGTDKMGAYTAVGTIRTYARIPQSHPFTYESWMQAVRRAETFVTYGPLLDFSVDGRPMGSHIQLPSGGGKVDIHWQVASVTVPTTRVQLVVNGEIKEEKVLSGEGNSGSWSVHINKSSWLALLVRGQYSDQLEMIAAHSSPVMVNVDGTQLLSTLDAVTILEQIEGALAFLDTVSTRAEERIYKRMRMVLIASHRSLHNRLHQAGYFHEHSYNDA